MDRSTAIFVDGLSAAPAVVLASVGGGGIATFQSWRRARRPGVTPLAQPRSA